MERFWARFNEYIGGFKSNERENYLGDINSNIGDRERRRIVGEFEVPALNVNGVCLLELCNERELLYNHLYFFLIISISDRLTGYK